MPTTESTSTGLRPLYHSNDFIFQFNGVDAEDRCQI